ncbi:MAG: hypothetical protein JSR21_07800, partial [Proteobacteria bacterium]|nr:hypothetical protein [Pseudomonadota bacterium]
VGDALGQAKRLGRMAREMIRRRRAEARHNVPPDAPPISAGGIGHAFALLARALDWGSFVVSKLYMARLDRCTPAGVRRAPHKAFRPRPLNSWLDAAADAAVPRPEGANAEPARQDDPVALWQAAQARMRARRRAADRRALAAVLDRQPVMSVIAQVMEDIAEAGAILGVGAVTDTMATFVRRIADALGVAPDGTAIPDPPPPDDPYDIGAIRVMCGGWWPAPDTG